MTHCKLYDDDGAKTLLGTIDYDALARCEDGRELGKAFIHDGCWMADMETPSGVRVEVVYKHSATRKGEPEDWPWTAQQVDHVVLSAARY